MTTAQYIGRTADDQKVNGKGAIYDSNKNLLILSHQGRLALTMLPDSAGPAHIYKQSSITEYSSFKMHKTFLCKCRVFDISTTSLHVI